MKKAFSTLCCLDYTPSQVLALAVECGMDAVELRVDDRMLSEMTNISEVKESFQKNGVVICDIASSIFIRSEQIPNIWYSYIDLAHKLGAGAVRVFAGESLSKKSETIISDIHGISKALRELCRYALPLGIEIWLETHSELSTGELCRKVVQLTDMENLKILWDVMHGLEYGESLDETIGILGDLIAHVHLKDGRPDGEKLHYILTDLGEGAFPTGEVLSLLRQSGYDGYYSLEWESPWCEEIRYLYSNPKELLNKYSKLLEDFS